VLTLAACSDDSNGVSATSSTSAGATTTLSTEATTTTEPPAGVSTDFARAVIELGGVPRTVAVAETNEQRAQGLMGVENLGPLDGMLFVFGNEAVRSFWMKDTLFPLDVAFFDADGFLVSKTSMATCLDDDCPSYSSELPAQYALEAPLGALADLAGDVRLAIISISDGSGKEI